MLIFIHFFIFVYISTSDEANLLHVKGSTTTTGTSKPSITSLYVDHTITNPLKRNFNKIAI